MTRVDFYILDGESTSHLHRFACRLVEKAWARGLRSYINAGTAQEVDQLDDLLWTFRDISFVPHARLADSAAAATPGLAAVIGTGTEPDPDAGLLINLDPQVPEFFSRFERVAELVDSEGTRRLAGRERFRFYRDRGYQLDTHSIR